MSKLMVAGFAIVLSGGTAHAAPGSCPGVTTPEVEACLQSDDSLAQADLRRYTDAAIPRIGQDALPDFKKAEAAWAEYRRAECDAVWTSWSDGTARDAMALGCTIRLTRLHTHDIWRDWLTSFGGTPPVLPEPPIAP